MSDRTFVDTNVWVYAVDDADPTKQARARTILTPSTDRDIVLSVQILGEFYVTVTRKLARSVAADRAQSMVEQMSRLPVVAIDGEHVAAAIAGSRTWHVSYWDALVIAAAASAGCSTILSEDLADGARYGTVSVMNPFRSGHRISERGTREGEAASMGRGAGRRATWDDAALSAELGRYEQACRDARMRPNAIHSYWDYARRFLDWRTGEYRPRGATGEGRPVPDGPVGVDELPRQAETYTRAVAAAGLAEATIDTYHRHAMFFIRWLRGEFVPGRRLR